MDIFVPNRGAVPDHTERNGKNHGNREEQVKSNRKPRGEGVTLR